MGRAPDRSHLQRSRRICLACVLLFQLAWILPCTFFLLSGSSKPKLLTWEDHNSSKRIDTLGYSGAIKVLHDHDLSALMRIHEDWTRLWPVLKGNLSSKGFVQLEERTCFLWLPECFEIAKHERILQIVKEAIGQRVLLYGMTVWKGKNEALQRFHRNTEVGDCGKVVDFVYGANVQLISKSHKLQERLLQIVQRNMLLIEEESLTFPSKQSQFDFLARTFVERVKLMVSIPDLWLENLELKDGYGMFFHGRTLHRIGEPLEGGVGLLLQFISADCKVRRDQNYEWGSKATSHSLYMPPVLLVAGDHTKLGAVNDVRFTLVKEDGLLLKLASEKELMDPFVGSERELDNGVYEPFYVNNITVLFEANASIAWQDEGVWRFRMVGEASTTVMAHCIVERFLLLGKSAIPTTFRTLAGDGEQVIVGLTEGMLYYRTFKDGDLAHYEVSELRVGSAVLLSKKLLHALVHLDSEAGFMSFHWVVHGNETMHGNDTKASVENHLMKELLGNGSIQATEGHTVTLTSGQAYDPDNSEFCDIVIFVVEGSLLQVLPDNMLLQAFDVLLVPAHQPCVLWNIGGSPIKFFAMHLCRFEDDMQVVMSLGASGKLL